MKNQKGFSLIELLVVVIIIAIIAAIAIPSLLASRRAANQSATVANLRTIVSANATYAATVGNGNYGTFAQMNATPPGLLDGSWANAVVKNGYTFSLTAGTTPTTYCVTATRQSASSGDNSYSVSNQGVIYFAAGGTPPVCNADTGVITPGTVLGAV